jgi:hypothetical protein
MCITCCCQYVRALCAEYISAGDRACMMHMYDGWMRARRLFRANTLIYN